MNVSLTFTQQLGGYLLSMIFGSSLNWIVVIPYLKQKVGDELKISNPYLIVSFNVGMIARFFMRNLNLARYRFYITLAGVILYAICWMILGFYNSNTSILYVIPNCYMLLLGFIFIDPIDSTIRRLYQDQVEKKICKQIAAMSFGWLLFGLIFQMILNPTFEKALDIDSTRFTISCCIMGGLVTLFGALGTILFIQRPKNQVGEEVELPGSKSDWSQKLDQPIQEKERSDYEFLTEIKFYLLFIQLYFMNCPAMGSINYIQKTKSDGHIQAIYYISIGISTTLGNLLPTLMKRPYSIKTLLGVLQLSMLFSLSFISALKSYHEAIEIITFTIQFLLFGAAISFGIAVLQQMFDEVVKIIPYIFISTTLAVWTQYFLFDNIENAEVILVLNYVGILIAFMINLLLPRRFY
ncbi:hypothetical protein pb186bvf_018400 [Paramecium bursaria]